MTYLTLGSNEISLILILVKLAEICINSSIFIEIFYVFPGEYAGIFASAAKA
jgi:hypothetical protein